MSDPIDWDEEFAGDPDYEALSPEERVRVLRVMERMLELGMAAVYGDEAPDVPDAVVDCQACLDRCRARCCTLVFALTREEAARGDIAWNRARPCFIARDPDGYCPHLDRDSLACTVWDRRPLRCRRYDCRDDPAIWPDGAPPELKGGGIDG